MKSEISSEIRQLLRKKSNAFCADCFDSCTLLIDVDNGVFLCRSCAEIHEQLGFHVKNPLTDNFSEEEIQKLKKGDNETFNKRMMSLFQYESSKIPFGATDSERKSFITDKYINKKWFSLNPNENNQSFYNPRHFDIQEVNVNDEDDEQFIESESSEYEITSPEEHIDLGISKNEVINVTSLETFEEEQNELSMLLNNDDMQYKDFDDLDSYQYDVPPPSNSYQISNQAPPSDDIPMNIFLPNSAFQAFSKDDVTLIDDDIIIFDQSMDIPPPPPPPPGAVPAFVNSNQSSTANDLIMDDQSMNIPPPPPPPSGAVPAFVNSNQSSTANDLIMYDQSMDITPPPPPPSGAVPAFVYNNQSSTANISPISPSFNANSMNQNNVYNGEAVINAQLFKQSTVNSDIYKTNTVNKFQKINSQDNSTVSLDENEIMLRNDRDEIPTFYHESVKTKSQFSSICNFKFIVVVILIALFVLLIYILLN